MDTFEGIRVYAAGKITKNGWRHTLFPIVDDIEYENADRMPWPAEVRGGGVRTALRQVVRGE